MYFRPTLDTFRNYVRKSRPMLKVTNMRTKCVNCHAPLTYPAEPLAGDIVYKRGGSNGACCSDCAVHDVCADACADDSRLAQMAAAAQAAYLACVYHEAAPQAVLTAFACSALAIALRARVREERAKVAAGDAIKLANEQTIRNLKDEVARLSPGGNPRTIAIQAEQIESLRKALDATEREAARLRAILAGVQKAACY